MGPRHSISLPVIAACTMALVACAKPDPQASNVLPIVVPEDTLVCEVLEQSVPCTDIPAYVAKTLEIATSRPIIVSDHKTGRTDDAVTRLVDELRKAGYSKVLVVGYSTERLPSTQRL
jgi:hypothetical protein